MFYLFAIIARLELIFYLMGALHHHAKRFMACEKILFLRAFWHLART
jgi:hypothetical protein